MTQKFVVSFIYSVLLKQPVAKVTSCILATSCKLKTIFTSSNCCFSFIPPAPRRLHCNCHHYYYHPITSSLQSSSLSLFSCSEKPLIFFSLSHFLRITMRSRLASESHKIPLRAGEHLPWWALWQQRDTVSMLPGPEGRTHLYFCQTAGNAKCKSQQKMAQHKHPIKRANHLRSSSKWLLSHAKHPRH